MSAIRKEIFEKFRADLSLTDSAVPDTGYQKKVTVMQSPSNGSAASSEGGAAGYTTVFEQAPYIAAELEKKKFGDDATLPARVFEGIGTDAEISAVLKRSKLYSHGLKRWTKLDTLKTAPESWLYPPVESIVNGILTAYNVSDTRMCCLSHKKRMPHVESQVPKFVVPLAVSNHLPTDESTHDSGESDLAVDDTEIETPLVTPDSSVNPQVKVVKSSPDLAIVGYSDNAHHDSESPVRLSPFVKPEYTETITPIEVKTLKGFNERHALVQVAVYARQIFIQQSNRKAVCCLVLTPKHVRLYIFDREGVCYSTLINIHANPVLFVRIILGVAGHDNHKLAGFDPSIFYKGGIRYLKTLGADRKDILYTIETHHETGNPEPFFRRFAIYGRGTVCWLVIGADGTYYIVKDAWRTKGRHPEWKILERFQARKLTPDKRTGVGRMVAYEDDASRLSQFRKVNGVAADRMKELLEIFNDRTFCRVTLEVYGSPVEGFNTRESVLFAFRDAIRGHQNLWDAEILHRDVSVNNILLGRPGAEEGWRGVLIDLDMAIEFDRVVNSGHYKTGTRAFQSINVLKKYAPRHTRTKPHDYLDDLESFYYALCWLCCGYEGPGKKLVPFPSELKDWENGEPTKSTQAKVTFMHGRFDMEVTPYFGEIFLTLLDNLHEIFKAVNYELANQTQAAAKLPKLDLYALGVNAKDDYAKVLGFFDAAIEELANEVNPPSTPPRRHSPPSLGFNSGPKNKYFYYIDESPLEAAHARHSSQASTSQTYP